MNSPNTFKTSQILLPIAIGLVVIVWLFAREFDTNTFDGLSLSIHSVAYLLLALLLMLGRDIGLIWRFRMLSNRNLSWHQSFNIHILNEFTSAVTPSAVGGSALVVLFLHKEGIGLGRSTAIMITNLFLDELFFVLICPLVFLLVPLEVLFNTSTLLTASIGVVFWSVYGVLMVWTTVLFIGPFIRPDWISKFMMLVFKLPFLNRWHSKMYTFSESLLHASHVISSKPIAFWVQSFAITSMSWTSRFLVTNALFMAFTPIANHFVIFGRQLMLWMVMVVSPTPGGSGISEITFKAYYSDLLLGSGTVLIVILLLRLISYYLYLLIGVIIIPKWIARVF